MRLSEIIDKEAYPSRVLLATLAKGSLAMGLVLLRNLGGMRRLQAIDGSVEFPEAPKRRYPLPEYNDTMRVCNSTEKYLRPTPYCNCRAPEIAAMAHGLGAYRKSDRDYATSVFEFVKRQLVLQAVPLDDVVRVLERGTGSCIQKNSLFIALCRAGGLKARYKVYAAMPVEAWYGHLIGADPLLEQWHAAMGHFMLHGEAEVLIDGEWVTADVAPTPERQAAAGIPITKLGEDSIGVWLFAAPGTIVTRESISVGLGLASVLGRPLQRLLAGSIRTFNASILSQIEKGRRILDEQGEAAYDAQARKTHTPRIPTVALERHPSVVFRDD